MQQKISAIVVVFHSGAILQQCLKALTDQPDISEIILVLNGVGDVERPIIAQYSDKFPERVHVIKPGANTGFARGCNLAAAKANGDIIALINPDLVIGDGFGKDIIAEINDRPDGWIFGIRVLDTDRVEQRGSRRSFLTPWRALADMLQLGRLFPDHPHFSAFNQHQTGAIKDTIEIPTVSGCCMVMPARAWRDLGGMDEDYFLHVEDIDLCLRAHKMKGQVYYCGGIEAVHTGGSSKASTLFIEWHKTKSLALYFRKHFTGPYPHWALSVVVMVLWARFLVNIPAMALKDGLGRRRNTP